MKHQQHILGCILGTAVGDAIGLPREGLSRRRAERLFGKPPLEHALFAGRGMCSDDTEHTIMLGQSLLTSGGDPERFARDFARRLRWWLVRVPAGVGLGTLKACLKLWLGVSPARSGVRSAGNGPAMRSALLGVYAPCDEQLAALVVASTAVTHNDARAHQGAAIIAVAARWATGEAKDMDGLERELRGIAVDQQLRDHLKIAFDAARSSLPPDQFAEQLGQPKGVNGFVNHTVPAALYCWLAHRGSFRDAVESAVCLGGDSDTTAAITGALAGTELGPDAIPQRWLNDLREWPCDVAWMAQFSEALAGAIPGHPQKPPTAPLAKTLARNVLFTLIVLIHGFRRLLPPY